MSNINNDLFFGNSEPLEVQILSLILKNKIDVNNYNYLGNILYDENFILFFYAQNFKRYGLNFNREILSKHLVVNAPKWRNPKQNYYKSVSRSITDDYIQSRVKNKILSGSNYNRAFVSIVLDRYDYLMNIETNLEDTKELRDLVIEEVKDKLGEDLLNKMMTLRSNGLYFNKHKFNERQLIDFVQEWLDVNSLNANVNSYSDYNSHISSLFINELKKGDYLGDVQLGNDTILPAITKDSVWSIIGTPKVGKTRFAVGEVLYPLIISGVNVEYHSCEIKESTIRSLLVVKHIFAEKKYKLSKNKVEAFIAIDLLLKELDMTYEDFKKELNPKVEEIFDYTNNIINQIYLKSKKKFDLYEKLSSSEKGIINIYYNELFFDNENSGYGKLVVRETDGDTFDIDKMEQICKSSIKDNKIDCFILDHASHYYSNGYNSKDKQPITEVYKIAKSIAKDESPVPFIIINHINTEDAKSLQKNKIKDLDLARFRAHGTSASSKYCDVELALIETQDDIREGVVKMIIQFARDFEIKENIIPLVAQKDVCDYKYVGSNNKKYKKIGA